MSNTVKHFYDETTNTLTYVVFDNKTKDAIIIDPVLDYSFIGSKVSSESIQILKDFIESEGLNVHYILETHAHADHLSGAQELKKLYPNAKTAIGERIKLVQKTFKGVYNLPEEFSEEGQQFDILLKDGEVIKAGSLEIEIRFTPGHTPACSTYKIGEAVFTGDALFMPDSGTGRCDFPQGSADQLYDSITKQIYSLPDDTKVYVGHDYQPNGRELRFQTTVGEEKKKNIQLPANRTKEEFVKFRTERDKSLKAPKLLYPSILINIDAGNLPPAEKNGKRYLKTPLNISIG